MRRRRSLPRLALGEDNILERVFIVKMVLDKNKPNQIAGAAGFSVREKQGLRDQVQDRRLLPVAER
jgi:hypothetical protein